MLSDLVISLAESWMLNVLWIFVNVQTDYSIGTLNLLVSPRTGNGYRFARFRGSELHCQIYLNNQFIFFNFPLHVLHFFTSFSYSFFFSKSARPANGLLEEAGS